MSTSCSTISHHGTRGIMPGTMFNSDTLATGVKEPGRYGYGHAPIDVADRGRRLETVCVRHRVLLWTATL